MIEVFRIIHICCNNITYLIFCSTPGLTLEATVTDFLTIRFIMIYKFFFSARVVNILNNLPKSVVNASTVNAFKARLDKFLLHQAVR